jgi:hypothetical protein
MATDAELFAAMKNFGNGIREYQQTQAVNEAQAKMQEINAAGMKEQERTAAVSQLGQGLALRLTGAHADPAAISAAVATLTPSASEHDQAKIGQETSAAHNTSAEKIAAGNNATTLAAAGIKSEGQKAKDEKKNIEGMNKHIKEFADMPHVKEILKGLPKLQKSLESLNAGDGKFGVNTLIELSKLGAIRDAAGRVNEKEIEAANESVSVRQNLWKRSSLASTGQPPKDVMQFWKAYLGNSVNESQKELHDAAEGHAQSLATVDPSVDSNQIASAIHQRFGIKGPKANPNQAYIDQLKASIAANPNQSRRAEAEAKIKQLEQGQ